MVEQSVGKWENVLREGEVCSGLKKFFLPEENRSGIALSIRQNGRELSYRVIGGEQAVLPDSLYLIAHTRGAITSVYSLRESCMENCRPLISREVK